MNVDVEDMASAYVCASGASVVAQSVCDNAAVRAKNFKFSCSGT